MRRVVPLAAIAAAAVLQQSAQAKAQPTAAMPPEAPLVCTHWTCPTCGLSVRGAPPRVCMNDDAGGCPIGSCE